MYGPDLVDRWKARAFAQDPGSQTPCCGYEEEDTNWGGSSILLGERKGPVRAVRETWGGDSGTNVIRRESFYRDTMVQKTWLRVHVIPPLDGIYAQWDFNAGKVDRFYNSRNPQGVAIDGRNDEVYGNFDDPCNPRWERNERSAIDEAYRDVYQSGRLCDVTKALAEATDSDWYHQSVDPGDLTFADANVALGWSEVAGPNGTIVDRVTSSLTDVSPGGAIQGLAAVPYYRDDSCFDDGTGSDPGPVMNLRSDNESMKASDGTDRKCWKPSDGDPKGSDHFFQGSIGTHGLHLLFLVDSDNARLTIPTTEIVSNWQMVDAAGRPGQRGRAVRPRVREAAARDRRRLARERLQRRAPRVQRHRRRDAVPEVDVDADVARRPLGETLGEPLRAVRARAGLPAVVAPPAAWCGGVERLLHIGRDQRSVYHVTELVKRDARDSARAVRAGNPAEVQPYVVPVTRRAGPTGDARREREDLDGHQSGDSLDDPARLRTRRGDSIENRALVVRRSPDHEPQRRRLGQRRHRVASSIEALLRGGIVARGSRLREERDRQHEEDDERDAGRHGIARAHQALIGGDRLTCEISVNEGVPIWYAPFYRWSARWPSGRSWLHWWL